MTPSRTDISKLRELTKLAEVSAPGAFIRQELEARHWTQEDLSRILGRPLQAVSTILNGKKAITPKTAAELASAFGTSAELWLNLESQYQLSRTDTPHDQIAKRAKLFDALPIREMVRREWIVDTSDADELERSLLKFLRTDSLDEPPKFKVAARKGTTNERWTWRQIAWLCRAREQAEQRKAVPFRMDRFQKRIAELPKLSRSVEQIDCVFQELAALGIRLVIVKALQGSKIDGATFWLDKRSPVVALAMRYGRLDYFWFTLMHELAHIEQEDPNASILDSDILNKLDTAASPSERKANRQATQWLVPQRSLSAFVKRARPYFSREAIRRFADTIGVHSGIVVGQLHHGGHTSYNHLRDELVNVAPWLDELHVCA